MKDIYIIKLVFMSKWKDKMAKKIYILVFVLVALTLMMVVYGLSGKNSTGKVISESESRKIEIKGSDTLLQMVSNLAEEYSGENPETKISVTGGGSGTGIAALINKEIDIADSSRLIKDKERAQSEERGIFVYEFVVARDMLSVIVNSENPVKKLTMEEIGKIYRGEITNWKDLGGKDMTITLYGRQTTSGTYEFFLEHIVKGEYSSKMLNLEGNQAILDAVKQDKSGMGYVGIGYIRDENGNPAGGIGVLSVAKDLSSEYASALDESKISIYPISRPLVQYFAQKPKKGSETYNFLTFELGEAGQTIVEKSGFVKIFQEDRLQNQKILLTLNNE